MQSAQHEREAAAPDQPGLTPTGSTTQVQGTSPRHSHAKNRGRLDVMADVLDCCRSSSSKSHIMLFANVNSIVATRMIEALTDTGLLDSVHEEGSVFYLATQRGTGFVAKYVELQRLVSPELVPAESKMNNPNRLNSLNF
jgi:predicted transcriptional regulator